MARLQALPQHSRVASALRWAAAAIVAIGLALVLTLRALTAPEPGAAPPQGAAVEAGPGPSAGDRLLAGLEALRRHRSPGLPGASREGLLGARDELEAALAQGLSEPALAHRALAEVHATLASEWSRSLEERREHAALEAEALGRLVGSAPGDPEARYRHALGLADRQERIAALAAAARLAPDDPRPRRALGEDLLEAGRADEGARALLEAAWLYDREGLETAYSDLRHLLRSHGREEEEARLRERLEALPAGGG